jgi:hypothetical protein
MRDFKFRSWSLLGKRFWYFDIHSGFNAENSDRFTHPEQFTGVQDENGVDLYEGDTVECNNGHVGWILWEENDCCFNVDGYYSSSDDYPTMAFMEGQPFKKLGNIHENKELL